MCEDRALRMKRGSRLGRIHHGRYRSRVIRLRTQVPPVLHDDSSSGCSSDAESNDSPPPTPPPVIRNPTAERVPTYDALNYRFPEDPCCKIGTHRTRRESLIDIAMRTVVLMRRNQQLQLRLAALQAETRDFIQAVMNNPENQRSPAQSTDSDYNSASPSSDEKMDDEDSKDGLKVEQSVN